MIRTLVKIAKIFNLTGDLTAEEKLVNITKEERQKNLLADLRHIRNSGFYKPNYDKENKLVILACPRPVDFGNDIEAWINSVRKENTFNSKERQRKEEEFQDMMSKRYLHINIFMNRFMKVE